MLKHPLFSAVSIIADVIAITTTTYADEVALVTGARSGIGIIG